MVARKLLVIALAATLLLGGVAATGAASIQDAQPADEQDDRTPGNAGPADDASQDESRDAADGGNDSVADRGNGSVADRGNGSASDRANASAPADVGPDGERGPPTEMPVNVPDHVSQIHETIDGFLSGDVDDLGDALSEILGGDDAGEDESDEEEGENESDDAAEAEDADDVDSDEDADDDSDATDDETEDDAEESDDGDADDEEADA